ncbi:MAG: YqgE/AlgH family protein [Proteobacteria bacterium]|nr:YqgE/AlgH family protein [Pseudomonadota bacterium]
MIQLIRKYLLLSILSFFFSITSFVFPMDGFAGEKVYLEKGVFLVAKTGIGGQYFKQTVILLIKHGREGTSGLIINRPSKHLLSSVLPGFKQFENSKELLFVGGPLKPHIPLLLLRAEEAPHGWVKIVDDVYYSHNIDIIARKTKDKDVVQSLRVYGGYAGWASGQLEAEISRGGWSIEHADAGSIFDKNPEDVWGDLIKKRETTPAGMMLVNYEK